MASAVRSMSDAEVAYTYQRMRRMGDMIEATERKLVGLYSEARRYGMDDILTSDTACSDAWNREIAVAKIRAALRGQPNTLRGGGI